jgi:hypothetical protein
MDQLPSERPPKVFLSASHSDHAVVDEVAAALRETGANVWYDRWELASGDSIRELVDQTVHTSDFFLVFLSKASVASEWVRNEVGAALAQEMNDRAITVIPVLIEACDVPPLLADKKYFDLSGNVAAGARRLAEQLVGALAIDLSRLDGRTFERLVTDLLARQGFETMPSQDDSGVDLIATRESPGIRGNKLLENWVVEVKQYRQQRVGVATIQQVISHLTSASSETKGLLVTNGNLTSVAREFLSDAAHRAGREVRVIDATELKRLLSSYPDLVARYFAPSGQS